jgi:hypothetical protein
VETGEAELLPPSLPPHLRIQIQGGIPPLPFHRLAGGTLDLLSFFLRLHFLLRARFASCLTVSLGKLTPHGTLWAPQDLAQGHDHDEKIRSCKLPKYIQTN